MRVLHSRVMRLEAAASPRPAELPVTPARPVPGPEPIRKTPPGRQPVTAAPRLPQLPSREDLEDLVGGRVLAWIGGAAVVLGLAFFFALAISHGWIGIEARTVLAGLASLAVLGVGIWLREHRGRNEAAMAAAATGLAGLFLTVVVAARVYELIPALPAVALGLAVGAVGVGLALRWNAQVVGGLGTLGAALSPVLAHAPYDGTTIALLFVATGAGAAVLVHKNWRWLAMALFIVATPQWAPWVVDHQSAAMALLTLCAFGAAALAAAVGFAVRTGSSRLSHTAAFLVAANALVLGAVGWVGFHAAHAPSLANAWLVALAVVHIVVGCSMRLEKRVARELALLSLAIGVVLADIAWGTIVDGPGVAIGWALAAVGFAWAASRGPLRGLERHAAMVGLGGQIAIALGHILTSDVPVSAISGTADVDGLIALASLAAVCLLSGRLAEDEQPEARALTDIVGLAAVAYLTATTLGGAALVAALAAEAWALALVARARHDELAKSAALAFLALASLHALAIEAPPVAFLYGAHSTGALAVALGAIVIAGLRIAFTVELAPDAKRALIAAAAGTALYGVSVAVVTAFQPGSDVASSTLLDVSVRQQGQMLVSGLWSLAGAAALVVGLTRNLRDLRVAGLALLAAAIAKVFLFDLATLTSVYRVVSFVALGLVLLGGSYAWQRFRPARQPDLREVT